MNTATSIPAGDRSIEPPGSDSDPWRSDGGRAAVVRRGVLVLIAVLTAFFLLFLAAYVMRMQHGDWRPLPEPPLLWFNTALLFAASVTLQLAVSAWRRERRRRALVTLHLAGALALAFLLGQLWVWRQLSGTGYFSAANPATAFFYLLTGLHAVHLLGGLVVWGRVSLRMVCGAPAAAVGRVVELCALYWHFLLLVWLLLFGVFLMT
jgi:cytochrome c oxidase subunit 3